MTKVIIISTGESSDSYYEQVQAYLKGKYHNYPTNLKGNERLTGKMLAAAKEGEGHARQIAESYNLPDGFNPAKHVV